MVGAGAVEKNTAPAPTLKRNTAPAPTKTLRLRRLRLRNPAIFVIQ